MAAPFSAKMTTSTLTTRGPFYWRNLHNARNYWSPFRFPIVCHVLPSPFQSFTIYLFNDDGALWRWRLWLPRHQLSHNSKGLFPSYPHLLSDESEQVLGCNSIKPNQSVLPPSWATPALLSIIIIIRETSQAKSSGLLPLIIFNTLLNI